MSPSVRLKVDLFGKRAATHIARVEGKVFRYPNLSARLLASGDGRPLHKIMTPCDVRVLGHLERRIMFARVERCESRIFSSIGGCLGFLFLGFERHSRILHMSVWGCRWLLLVAVLSVVLVTLSLVLNFLVAAQDRLGRFLHRLVLQSRHDLSQITRRLLVNHSNVSDDVTLSPRLVSTDGAAVKLDVDAVGSVRVQLGDVLAQVLTGTELAFAQPAEDPSKVKTPPVVLRGFCCFVVGTMFLCAALVFIVVLRFGFLFR